MASNNTVTSAPVSTLNFIKFCPILTCISHMLPLVFSTVSRYLTSSYCRTCSLSGCSVVTEIVAMVFERHWELKFPRLLHLKQVASFAGQDCRGCAPVPHLQHLLNVGLSDVGGIAGNFLLVGNCFTASRELLSCLISDRCKISCWVLTDSRWRIDFLALSRVSSGSSCKRSDKAESQIPMTKRSWVNSSFIPPNSQFSANLQYEVL